MTKSFNAEMEAFRTQADLDLQNTKRQLGDMNKKLEQRLHKMEADRQQQQSRFAEELERIERTHKDELNRVNEKRMRDLAEANKEGEQKVGNYSC
jgi:hypothetical protein